MFVIVVVAAVVAAAFCMFNGVSILASIITRFCIRMQKKHMKLMFSAVSILHNNNEYNCRIAVALAFSARSSVP